MKNPVLWIVSISLLIFQNCTESEVIDHTPLDIFIGRDTTIACGDTLFLDAGAGYDSYSWHNGISTNQVLAVTAPGPYWVEVRQGGRIGRDSIRISTDCITATPCDTLVDFFYQTLEIPCSYNYLYFVGDDSHITQIWSEIDDVILEYERGFPFEYDTIYQLTPKYNNTWENQLTIFNQQDQELGQLFFNANKGTFRNVAGYFFIKQSTYYVGIMHVSFSSYKINEIVNILSTIKPKE
jgi:hypothetical protein